MGRFGRRWLMTVVALRWPRLSGFVATAAQHVKDFGAAKGVVFWMTTSAALCFSMMAGLALHIHLVLFVVEAHSALTTGQIKSKALCAP